MKAARYDEHSNLVYGEVEDPQPEAEEAIVRVRAVGVNPVDWKSAKPGLIPGWDIAGTIEWPAAESDNDVKQGDAVVGLGRIRRQGAYAELVAVRQSDLAPKPESLDFTQAAAVPLASLTAWQALVERGELQTGQRVLIHAAAGGVGTFAVQFAHALGAHVSATASAANRDLLVELGADEVIDYTTTDGTVTTYVVLAC